MTAEERAKTPEKDEESLRQGEVGTKAEAEEQANGEAQEEGMGTAVAPVHSLPLQVLAHIFTHLSAKEVLIAACVQRSWRQLADEESVWRTYCKRDWMASAVEDAPGAQCSSFKEAYVAFVKEYGKYGDLFPRAQRCLAALRAWCEARLPEVGSSLLPGCSEAELDDAERELGVQLPPVMRAWYRVCNGQRLRYDEQLERDGRADPHPSAFHGLLGGYSFYDHNVNVRLLPLARIVKWSDMIAQRFPHARAPAASGRLIIAASFNLLKIFFIDLADGSVHVGKRDVLQLGLDGNCLPAVRDQPPPSADRRASDGFLRWVEEYSGRLRSGLYGVRNINDWPLSTGICLFPESPPACTRAVTKGVEVRCSSIFVPEVSSLVEGASDRYFHSYSVRMRLLPALLEERGLRFSSCQLRARHWIITDGEHVENVRGEAVIGKYPLLVEGGPEFVYQSCCAGTTDHGSIEGEFNFVPGRLSKVEGEEFDAEVARFPVAIPAFIY